MDYVILDLEWNQAMDKSKEDARIPFEVIEIGAVRMNEEGVITDRFDRLVKPAVYRQLHYRVREMTRLSPGVLNSEGRDFAEVFRDFAEWCGEDVEYCTWGSMDLTQLQLNIRYHGIANPYPYPFLYYDVQKLYGLFVEDSKAQMSLEHAAQRMGIAEEKSFHRAINDAEYTARILAMLDADFWKELVSVDYFRPPLSREEEIRLKFRRYDKFVSMVFPDRESLTEDGEVRSLVCCLCGKPAAFKQHWFAEGNHYLALGQCKEHGWIKGKIRVKSFEDKVFGVKTVKMIGPRDAARIKEKHRALRERRREKLQPESTGRDRT